MNSDWWLQPVRDLDADAYEAARKHQQQLTKPPGSLGQLETIAVRLAAMQATVSPTLDNIVIAVFASDHGIAEEGVSAFPQAVTAEMVRNFARGGAAISVLARELEAHLEVINMGTVTEIGPLDGVLDQRVAPGTANFARHQAMTESQLRQALQAGSESAGRANQRHCRLYVAGDMGIANTTAATAMACAMLGCDPEALAGPGTGLDREGVRHKAAVIEAALAYHRLDSSDTMKILHCVSGFEIAAMVGAYIRCAQLGITVVVDGFIATAAALAALRLSPATANWLFYAHSSAEPGHRLMMEALNARPLLDLGMRLGEGSGAAVAIATMRLAVALHNGMATFSDAGISGRKD